MNSQGFVAQPTNDSNPMANFLQSTQNKQVGQGSASVGSGQTAFGAGTQAFAPLLDYLTKLTKGDSGDLTEATQSQTGQIKDSFAAARNMISGQPRGGGKAGVLAEAPFKQSKEITDMQSQARSAAAGQLGGVASSLAGLGTGEEGVGQNAYANAVNEALGQRNENFTSGSTISKFGSVVGALSNAGRAAADIIGA